MTRKAGLDRLDLAEARRIGELVKVKIGSFLKPASNLPGENYDEAFKEAYVQLLFDGILKMNGNQDPRVEIQNAMITPEVLRWYEKADLALKEEEALREKYRKALFGKSPTEH